MPCPRIYFGIKGGGGTVTTAQLNAAIAAATLPALPYAEEIQTFPFSFNTTVDGFAQVDIFTIPAGARIVSARIELTTAFDSLTATLDIGDAVINNRLMNANQNIPSELGVYEANVAYTYVAATIIKLHINPSGSTMGEGYVVIEYNLNT